MALAGTNGEGSRAGSMRCRWTELRLTREARAPREWNWSAGPAVTARARRPPFQRPRSPRTAQRRLALPDPLAPGRFDEDLDPAAAGEIDDAGVLLHRRLREDRPGGLHRADHLEVPEGVAHPVDRGGLAHQKLRPFCRHHQRDRIEEDRRTARERVIGRHALALGGL